MGWFQRLLSANGSTSRPYLNPRFDTSVFDPALVEFYQTEEGQVGLPFAVFPGAMYYVPAMFDEVGLAYPPQVYGEQYELDGEMVDWNWDDPDRSGQAI